MVRKNNETEAKLLESLSKIVMYEYWYVGLMKDMTDVHVLFLNHILS